MTVLGGRVKGSTVLFADRVDIRAKGEESADDSCVARQCCIVERRGAI